MLEPAKTITDICGGVSKVARLAECSYSVALRFGYPKSKGGNGGLIPINRAQIILKNAVAEGLPLKPEHFFDQQLLQKSIDSSPVAEDAP